MNEHVVALMLKEIDKYLTDVCFDDGCSECVWWNSENYTCNLEKFEENLKEMLP